MKSSSQGHNQLEKQDHEYDKNLYSNVIELEQKADETSKKDNTPVSAIVDTVVEFAGAIIEAIIT